MKDDTATLLLVGLAVAAAGFYFFVIVPNRVGGAQNAGTAIGLGFVDTANPSKATADGSSGYATPQGPSSFGKPKTLEDGIRAAVAHNEVNPRATVLTSDIRTLAGKEQTPTMLPPTTNVVSIAPAALPKVDFAGIAESSLTIAKQAVQVKESEPLKPPAPVTSRDLGFFKSPTTPTLKATGPAIVARSGRGAF